MARHGQRVEAYDALDVAGCTPVEQRCLGVGVGNPSTDVIAGEASREGTSELTGSCGDRDDQVVAADPARRQPVGPERRLDSPYRCEPRSEAPGERPRP